ncbi:hypothetical protein NA57DRAFT_75201 [Rhizodiscina lignyota]|uniref:Uncharacterized protein n=1 Tax=Rhizodiscina lignyota TaxID=1504668 RepID=A0A9P4ID73_9PEZI|nr:hypothetical protein NA57DRAFT_75201 [Rhizodiscina lignyota]
MSDGIHSTGRGGAGNIGPDSNTYVDAGIVREGVVGDSPRPEYSTGRGGVGNMESPRLNPGAKQEKSKDFIPETSLREGHENYHTGRGGAGNEHIEKYGGHSQDPNKETLGDKVKQVLRVDKKKDGQNPTQ